MQRDQRENQALKERRSVNGRRERWRAKHALLDLGQDNKKHGVLRGPHCLGYRRGNRFWQSLYDKTDELVSIQVS